MALRIHNPAKPRGEVLELWWLSGEQWQLLKEIAPDAERLLDSYAEWSREVGRLISEARALGIQVREIDLDVNELRQWCLAHGVAPDAQGRAAFTSAKLRELYAEREAEREPGAASPEPEAVIVSLDEVLTAMQRPAEWTAYLDRETGEIVQITDDVQSLLKEEDDDDALPEWLQESLAAARRVLASEHALELPGQFEIHEWGIMEEFALAREDDGLRDTLSRAIRGSGAFRRFKDAVYRHGVEKEWYAFRDAAIEQVAKEWLEEHGLRYR